MSDAENYGGIGEDIYITGRIRMVESIPRFCQKFISKTFNF